MASEASKDPTALEAGHNGEPAVNGTSMTPTINFNHLDPPSIDIHHVSNATAATPHRLSQPSFLDNQFGSDALQNGSQALIPADRHAKRQKLSVGPGQTLSYTPHAQGSVSGSEDDRSEDVGTTNTKTIKTIKTVHDFGLGSLDRPPSSSKSHNEFHDTEETGSPVDSPVISLSGVEGAGSGLLISHPDLKQIESDFTNLAPGQEKASLSVESIANQISRSMSKSAVSDDYFLPADQLDIIINRDIVYYLLDEAKPGQSEQELRSNIREVLDAGSKAPVGRRRIFATLILMECTKYIFDFIDARVYDSNLPLAFDWKSDRNEYDVTRLGDSAPIQLCDNWKRPEMMLFQSQQMTMLAPVFQQPDTNLKNYTLTWKTILPFLEHEHKTNGGFGKVYKVKIHQAHYDFPPQDFETHGDEYFAIKALDVNDHDKFHDEVDILKRFSAINTPHPHLIKLLLTYQHRDNYYLLFHWAQSNLKEYWREHSNRPRTPQTFKWFMTQCLGIASGLQQIHRAQSGSDKQAKSGHLGVSSHDKNHGRHGDIKPENILCFQKNDDVHLVITDFGLSRYHSRDSVSVSKEVKGYTGTYRPPECDSRNTGITQRYDIWTLGCLFLEFISWLVLGNYETEIVFARARINDDAHPNSKADTFFIFDQYDEAKVKVSVINWMSKIRKHESCPAFADKMLDLVENHLLVPDSGSRWDSNRVRQELKRIQESLHKSPNSMMRNGVSSSSRGNELSAAAQSMITASEQIHPPRRVPPALCEDTTHLTVNSSISPGAISSNNTTPCDTQISQDAILIAPEYYIPDNTEPLVNDVGTSSCSSPKVDVVGSAAELELYLQKAISIPLIPTSGPFIKDHPLDDQIEDSAESRASSNTGLRSSSSNRSGFVIIQPKNGIDNSTEDVRIGAHSTNNESLDPSRRIDSRDGWSKGTRRKFGFNYKDLVKRLKKRIRSFFLRKGRLQGTQ